MRETMARKNGHEKKTRREFVREETECLGRFLGPDNNRCLVRWTRQYRCDCGFVCGTASDIWDHVQEHKQKGRESSCE